MREEMDDEESAANWNSVRGILEEKSRPPSFPASLRMYVLRLPHRDKTTEFRSIELIHTVPISHNICRAEHFFSSNTSIWVPQNAEFDSKFED